MDMQTKRILKSRLSARSREKDGCLIWLGRKDRKGYGVFSVNNKNMKTHRASWLAHKGIIPNGLWVLHKCDNPLCFKFEHLFLGTPRDNVMDAISKGRHRVPYFVGESHKSSKLTLKQVLMIRQCYAEGKNTPSQLAKKCRVTKAAIRSVINNRNWKHALPPSGAWKGSP